MRKQHNLVRLETKAVRKRADVELALLSQSENELGWRLSGLRP